jgi:hypothetical protein
MNRYEKFTYDLSGLTLTKKDKAELEKEYSGAGEYMVCTNETADLAARGQILSSLWAFKADFLSSETNLPSEVYSCLQEKMSKDSNEAILALVRSTCGEDSIVDAAINSDGRGHFLATYDSDELTFTTKSGKTLYLYRCN